MLYKKQARIYLRIITIIAIFFIFTVKTSALTLDKTSYVSGESITFMDEGGAFIVFNDAGDQIGGDYSYTPGMILNQPSPFNRGNYKIIEFTYLDIPCFAESLSYDDCRQAEEFVTEFLFTITPASSGDGGADFDAPPLDAELVPAGGTISYTPEVNILSILKGSFFSDKFNIDYKVTDQNDIGNLSERLGYGLRDNPVSIYYSDKVSESYGVLSPTSKTQIVKDQPAVGKYEWSVKNLIPGTLYRIIVDAVDAVGLLGEGISELFGVDFSAPVFTVKVDPPAVRSGEVTISVDSSEDLGKIPEVKVAQNGGTAQVVVMTGEKNHYEGIYKVIPGFDGTAVIKISGADIAGNIGSEIVSGGTFNVGVNPPPKPRIDNYKEKVVTNNGFFDIKGSTRSDTEVALFVNGVQISKIKPESDGTFSFKQIKLDKTKNNGLNYVGIVAIDSLGTSSESVLTEVKYNIAPTVKIIKPTDKESIGNIYSIETEGNDENNDNVFYTYQVLPFADFKNNVFDWVTISESNPSKSFSWNTAEVTDGNYVLQVIADDKEAKTTSLPVQVTIKNVLPSFLFENGRSTITNRLSVIVKGKVISSPNLSPRPSIVSLAYSMDNGATWSPVKISNDGADYQKKFSVEFSLKKEGTYPILWRTKDSRDFIGKIIHPIVVDMTAPKAPSIIAPRLEKDKDVVINDSSDENSKKDGIQITINGKTDAFNNVSLVYGGKTFTTKALATGEFIFSDVTFDKKGKFILSIFTNDMAGNKSGNTTLSILYNNPPIISFINPKPFRGISGDTNVSWSIKDPDNDLLNNIVVSYRNKDKDTVLKTLVTNASAVGTYKWNTDKLVESNNYELKIEASDAYSSSSQIISFSIDRTPPILTSFIFDKNQIDENSKKISFVCKGEGADSLSGIEFVEYSIEDSRGIKGPWYKGVIVTGYLKNKASYQIKHPVMVSDGVYKLWARAVDTSGNVSEPLSLSLSVDKVAPRIGGFFFKKNNVSLIPDETGNIAIYKSSPFFVSISLEEDTENASIKIGDKDFKLEKDIKSQLWTANISVNEESTEKLLITAVDNVGNEVNNKEIGSVTIRTPGVITLVEGNNKSELVVGASVNVLKLNEETNQYNDFNVLGDNNSQILSNKSGEYNLTLPAGSYEIVVSGDNIKTLKSQLTLNRPSIVNVDFKTSKISKFRMFINKFLGIFK